MKLPFTKRGKYLVASDDQAEEYLSNKKDGALIYGEFTSPRNAKFHRKFFSLINHAFECWEPETEHEYAQKNLEVFRAWLIVAAGYYKIVYVLPDGLRKVPDSISFSKMNEDEFEKLYSNVINVILKYILKNYTKKDLDDVVLEIIRYA